jgi:SAM-dependent methyltransferase
MTTPFFMNSYLGKRILALVREGDFAHAGEEEAIALAMAPVAKDAGRRILDAGCGRGGTAACMQAHGWGRVTGIDIEPMAIDYASAAYPQATFLHGDINEVAKRFEEAFDVVTMFNVFYALPDHAAALRALASVSAPGAQLVIFDYVDPGRYRDAPMMDGDIPFLPNPLPLAGLSERLARGGWRLQSVADLNADYVRWYAALVAKIEAKREPIEALAGHDIYEHVRGLYAGLEAAVREERVGGAVIYAEKRAV